MGVGEVGGVSVSSPVPPPSFLEWVSVSKVMLDIIEYISKEGVK